MWRSKSAGGRMGYKVAEIRQYCDGGGAVDNSEHLKGLYRECDQALISLD
jgi:hypothetical protein